MLNTRELDDSNEDSGCMALVSDYVALTKPGIMALLLVTTLGAMLIAASGAPPFGLVLLTMAGGWMSAAGANVLNCVIDRDIDARMPRTRKRGTASGRIPAVNAFVFGLALTLGGFLLLGILVNWLSGFLALAGNVYYVLVYTLWLKRMTPQNIVIGGAAGAVPPLVGWAAVTGTLSPAAWILFAIIFYWTPPHFWALALLKQGEYGRVNVPMLPVVYGEEHTRRQIFLYTVMLAAVSLMLTPFGMSWIYLLGAVLLAAWFLRLTLKLLLFPSKALARKTFFYSIWYVAGLFAVMATDRLILG
jgi:protoheme IX farnesyltransferase